MKILSLFDGMSCGMLALQGAGVPVDRYVAYEIDKYAVQTSTHNFPMIEHRGDVFGADFTEFRGFDAVIGGSPCTFWSIAQKNNRETEASGMGWELFSQFLRAIAEVMPHFFIYENNKSMSRAIRASIDKAFGFEATEINSAAVSAQNRQRVYWVGKRNADGTYRKVHIEQPGDLGVLLKDILESGTAWQDKSFAYTTRCQGATPHDTLGKHRHTMVAEPVNTTEDGKAQCLRASCYKDGIRNMVGNTIDRKTCVAEPVPGYASPCAWSDRGEPTKASSAVNGKIYQVYEVKNNWIVIKDKPYPIKLPDGLYIFRRLTVRECMRLQTVPGWYAFPVSDTQAYKMLGNGWTVEVIKHLIRSVIADDDDDWML